MRPPSVILGIILADVVICVGDEKRFGRVTLCLPCCIGSQCGRFTSKIRRRLIPSQLYWTYI